MSEWIFEKIACYVAKIPSKGLMPLYRAWSGNNHFYTTNKREYERLNRKYKREGVACYVAPRRTSGFVPLHRFYHTTRSDHLYTIGDAEKRNLERDPAWRYEGVQCYVASRRLKGTVPLYRTYNHRIVDHFYTTGQPELEKCTGMVLANKRGRTDLIVRTTNTHRNAPHYDLRLRGIARKFRANYKSQVGLIGMQEVASKMPRGGHGAKFFANELSRVFPGTTHGRFSQGNQVGLAVGPRWRIIKKEHWHVGPSHDKRYLIEAYLRHRHIPNCHLRFYSTHLSNTSEKKRLRQAQGVAKIVRSRAMPGELPPIVVGDFNAQRDYARGKAPGSVRRMERDFWRPVDTFLIGRKNPGRQGIDTVYIGKKARFPHSRGQFRPVKRLHFEMSSQPVTVDGVRLHQLTDHHPDGYCLTIEL